MLGWLNPDIFCLAYETVFILFHLLGALYIWHYNTGGLLLALTIALHEELLDGHVYALFETGQVAFQRLSHRSHIGDARRTLAYRLSDDIFSALQLGAGWQGL